MDKAKLQSVLDGLPKEGAAGAAGAAADFTLPVWLLPIVKQLLQLILAMLP